MRKKLQSPEEGKYLRKIIRTKSQEIPNGHIQVSREGSQIHEDVKYEQEREKVRRIEGREDKRLQIRSGMKSNSLTKHN